MAKSLKDAGVRELGAFARRLRRQLALERISGTDHDYILVRIQEIESRITEMEEKGVEDEWL